MILKKGWRALAPLIERSRDPVDEEGDKFIALGVDLRLELYEEGSIFFLNKNTVWWSNHRMIGKFNAYFPGEVLLVMDGKADAIFTLELFDKIFNPLVSTQNKHT